MGNVLHQFPHFAVAKGLHVPCYISSPQDDVVEEETAEPTPPKMERRLNEETCPAYVPRLYINMEKKPLCCQESTSPYLSSKEHQHTSTTKGTRAKTFGRKKHKPLERLTVMTIRHEFTPFKIPSWLGKQAERLCFQSPTMGVAHSYWNSSNFKD